MVSTLLAAWAIAYAAMVVVVASRRGARVRDRGVHGRRALIVRPCTGLRGGVVHAMATLPVCPPGMTLTWIGCVADADDPAWALVQRCAATLRGHGVDAHAMLTGARGPNRKAEQIAIVDDAHGGQGEVLVVIDADVDLATVDLRSLVSPLGGTRDDGRVVGASWAAPIERDADTPGDHMSRAVLGGSWHAFTVLARLDRSVIVGKALAVSRAALNRIGPLAELRHYLGEDFELGRRIEQAGFAVHASPSTVMSLATGRSVADVVERYTRWLWVVRAQRPLRLLGYPLLIAAAPLLIAGAIAIAPIAPVLAAGVGLSTLLARLAIATIAARAGRIPRISALDALRADALLLFAFACACRRRTVRWAEHTLRIDAEGRLEPTTEAPDDGARQSREQARREAVTAGVHRPQR